MWYGLFEFDDGQVRHNSSSKMSMGAKKEVRCSLVSTLQLLLQAAPAASLSQLHVELSELRRSVRLVASNQQEVRGCILQQGAILVPLKC